jgi:hypothetical protein
MGCGQAAVHLHCFVGALGCLWQSKCKPILKLDEFLFASVDCSAALII